MKVDISDLDQLAIQVFRTKNQFSEIVTSFYSNIELEVIQVTQENEWKNTYSIKADDIKQEQKMLFSVKMTEVANVLFGF